MSLNFSFHPEAQWELRESVRYYEGEAAGLGAEFAAEIQIAVDRMLEILIRGRWLRPAHAASCCSGFRIR
ncbi:MAG: hypothetical protein C4527_01545 [Candidatus Omnitrophota bacterium]|nr:MAG: hypothetical protein C4527_01545 [Candidatus Omnitrophota bacterium]